MVSLNLFMRARSRSRSANATTENQFIAETDQRHSTATDTKNLDSINDRNRLHDPPSAKRQKTNSSLMSAFSSSLMKKITSTISKTSEEKPEDDCDVESMEQGNQRYPEGTYVATKYGTAIVLQYREEDNMYVLRMVYNAVAYFHSDSVVREIKCMVGDRVKTKWGMATVEHYYVEDDKYSIALDWRWDDDHVWRMKATTKMFDIPTPATATLKSRAQAARDLMSKTIGDGYTSLRKSSVTSWRPSTASYSSLIRMPVNGATNKKNTPVWSDLFGEGRLLSIRTADNVATIQFIRTRAIGYVQLDTYRELEFGSGDSITTRFGEGHVIKPHPHGAYSIQLSSGTVLYTANIASILLPKHSSSTYFKMPAALPKFQLPSLPQSRKEKYAVGDKLRSAFGPATLTALNGDVFECTVDGGMMLYVPVVNMDGMFPDALNSRFGKLYEKTKQAGKEWHSFSSSTMLYSAQAIKAQALSVKSSLMDSAFKKGPRYVVDERVLCPIFGSGFIVSIRSDGVYVVRLRKLKVLGYFNEDELKPFPYEKATHVIVGERLIPVPMEVYQATNKKTRSAIIKDSIASQRALASMT